jgi:hypothetical protein
LIYIQQQRRQQTNPQHTHTHVHRLAALEVAATRLEEQQRQPALLLADAASAWDGKWGEAQGRVEALERRVDGERKAAEVRERREMERGVVCMPWVCL